MKGTALGAENREMNFMNNAHEKFYYEKLKEVRYQDVYHKALVYCLKTGCVKTECLLAGWQTSGSVKVIRMAFNLYCDGAPSVDDYQDTEDQLQECSQYNVEELFCCSYAPYFWQAIQIRYSEYTAENRGL